MKSVSSCLCAVQIFSPCIHALRSMLKKSSFVASKTSIAISRYHIRSCRMLLKAKIVFKNCWWNKPIPGTVRRPNSGNYHCKTKCSRCFVHNFSTFFFTEGEFSNWNTRFVHLEESQKSVQITFHLIQNEIFRYSFKRLSETLQASTDVKCPRSQTVRLTWNADSAVIFINPCPEICILKAGKFPLLNLGSSVGSNFQWQLFALNQNPVFFRQGACWVEPANVKKKDLSCQRLRGQKLQGHVTHVLFSYFLVDARFSERKLLMSLKWIWKSK